MYVSGVRIVGEAGTFDDSGRQVLGEVRAGRHEYDDLHPAYDGHLGEFDSGQRILLPTQVTEEDVRGLFFKVGARLGE